jgi:hypothetical protein
MKFKMLINILTIHGIAKNVRHSTQISGTDEHISTSHLIVLEIDGLAIELNLPKVIYINSGDEVVVAGEVNPGELFQGLAYFNKTKGIVGNKGSTLLYILGFGLCLTVWLSPFGIWLIYKGIKNERALDAINNAMNYFNEKT